MPTLRTVRARTRLVNPNAPPPEQPVVFVVAPTTAAARPPSPAGRGLHRATDTQQITYFDGASWRPVTVRGAGLVEVSGGDFVSPARSSTAVVEEALGLTLEGTPGGAALVHDGDGGVAVCADAVAALLAADDAAGARTALAVYSTTQVDTALSLLAGGVAAKPNIQAATVGAIADLSTVTLAAVFSGYTPIANDRVLVKDGASPDGVAAVSAVYNGWYVVGIVGGGVAPLTRVADANASAEFVGVTTCIVASGSLAGKQYKTGQAATFVLGTDPITFTEIPATPLSDATPQPPGTASQGSGNAASRDDHVHAKEDATTTRGDLNVRGVSGLGRLALGALRRVLSSDGTDLVYQTIASLLDDVSAVRGDVLRRGASAWEAVTASTADTFQGGDGTDVVARTAAQVLASIAATRVDVIPLTASPGRWTLTPGTGASSASIDTSGQSLDLVVAAATASISFATVVPDAAKIPDLWNFTLRARLKSFSASGVGREVFARMGFRFSSGARVYLSAYDGTVTGGVEVYVPNGNTTTPQRLYTASAGACPLDGTGWMEIQFQNGVCGFRIGVGVGSAAPTTWKTVGSVMISTTDGATAASPGGWPSLQDVSLQAVTNNTSGGAFAVKWSDVSLRSNAGLL